MLGHVDVVERGDVLKADEAGMYTCTNYIQTLYKRNACTPAPTIQTLYKRNACTPAPTIYTQLTSIHTQSIVPKVSMRNICALHVGFGRHM